MSICVEKCEEVIECRTDIANLKTWQKNQNGAIHRVEAKVDKIILATLGVLATALISSAGTIILLLRGIR